LNKSVQTLFDQFSFPDNFLSDARAFWGQHSDGLIKSGPFTEKVDLKNDYTYEATALCMGNKKYLLIAKFP
jgi:hypothetical protein